jgi:hypothetical protein
MFVKRPLFVLEELSSDKFWDYSSNFFIRTLHDAYGDVHYEM